MKKTLSIFLSLIMLMSCFAAPVETYAASKPKATSITKVTAQAAAFKVTWKKGSGITGYQIQYSTSGKFAKKSTKTLKVNKAKTTSKTISKLAGQKKYYVRVRTYKTKGKKTTYSSWSKAKSVTTKLQGVSVKKLTAQKAAFKAEWSKVSGVTGYQIQYSTSGKFEKNNTKTVKINKNSTTAKTISKLKTNKKYYVRLRTYKTANKKTYYSSWSKSKAVTTLKNNAASGNTNQTTLSAPVIYLRIGGQDGTIEASLKSATLDNFQVEYQLCVNKDFTADIISLVANNTEDQFRKVTFKNLKVNTIFYVRARVKSGNTYSAWSKSESEKTKCSAVSDHILSVDTSYYDNNYKYDYSDAYVFTDAQKDEYRRLLSAAYNSMHITDDTSDVEKVMIIANWFSKNTIYGRSNIPEATGIGRGQTGYELLKYGEGVCAGISWLFNDFCYLANIPCYWVVGTTYTDHAWNFVKLNGNWYVIDATAEFVPQDFNGKKFGGIFRSYVSNFELGNYIYFEGTQNSNAVNRIGSNEASPYFKDLWNKKCMPKGNSDTFEILKNDFDYAEIYYWQFG